MGHQFNGGAVCPVCGAGRHYIEEVGKYIYTNRNGTRTFVEPKCLFDEVKKNTGADYSLFWEILVFLAVCVGIYFLASMVSERREQQRIEEYHSHITPATANDTL